MQLQAIKWCFACSCDTWWPRIKFSYNSKMAIFCYDVIYDVTIGKIQILLGKLISASSQMAGVAIKWTLVTFYDMYLLREIILPILEMTYLRYFDIYDVISVIFDENFQTLNSASSTMAVVAIKWTLVTFYHMYLLREIISPILYVTYLRYFNIYDVISVIFLKIPKY